MAYTAGQAAASQKQAESQRAAAAKKAQAAAARAKLQADLKTEKTKYSANLKERTAVLADRTTFQTSTSAYFQPKSLFVMQGRSGVPSTGGGLINSVASRQTAYHIINSAAGTTYQYMKLLALKQKPVAVAATFEQANTFVIAFDNEKTRLDNAISAGYKKIAEIEAALSKTSTPGTGANAAEKATGTTSKSTASSSSKATTTSSTSTTKAVTTKYRYNIPMPKEAYFNSAGHNAATLRAGTSESGYGNDFAIRVGGASTAVNTNSPGAWTAGAKGIIEQCQPVSQTTLAGTSGTSTWTETVTNAKQLYGFRFLYNPTSVAMAYATGPAVDVGNQLSGQEKFNLVTPEGQGTISFELLLNRMFDMKYINAYGLRTEWRDTVSTASPGALTRGTIGDAFTPLANPYPTTIDALKNDDLKKIYDQGTMYDVQHLLRAVLGYDKKTGLRGQTPDLGYLGAMPVLLYLGPTIRYLVRISSLSINHAVFNDRMVPVLTNVSITATRYIDPPPAGTKIKTASGSTAVSTASTNSTSSVYGNCGGHYEGSTFVKNKC